MKTTISIICYSQLDKVKLCLQSIFDGGGKFKLILTANGNSEVAEYFKILRDVHPEAQIQVVVNETNRGFIFPNEVALTMADTEFFCMVNDDCLLPFGWLGKIHRAFETYSEAAIVGPRGYRLRDNFVGGLEGKPIEYIEGVCLAVRTELAKKHGLFDPELKWAYGEDADLCLRMRALGHTLRQVDFPIHHKPGSTSSGVPETRIYFARNHNYLRQKWASYLQTHKFPHEI